MHKEYLYSSVFADHIKDHIEVRREAGFSFDTSAYWLYRFDQFCCDNNVVAAIVTKELYESWAIKADTETKTTQNSRLQALRSFCVYLISIGIPAYVPKNLPRPEKVVPYLMKDDVIREFFKQVDYYDTVYDILPFRRMAKEYKVVFRLIYCCGLRNNEACSLRAENIDLQEGIITLYGSKGRKDRLVYLSDDLCNLCNEYASWINRQFTIPPEWFFPGKDPRKHIPKTSLDRKFNEFWNNTETSKVCDKKPTVHSLRHAFVIKRINTWVESDIPLHVMMPYLSRYLGHMSPIETYYYYHQTEDTFQTVHRKDIVSGRVIPEVRYEG